MGPVVGPFYDFTYSQEDKKHSISLPIELRRHIFCWTKIYLFTLISKMQPRPQTRVYVNLIQKNANLHTQTQSDDIKNGRHQVGDDLGETEQKESLLLDWAQNKSLTVCARVDVGFEQKLNKKNLSKNHFKNEMNKRKKTILKEKLQTGLTCLSNLIFSWAAERSR